MISGGKARERRRFALRTLAGAIGIAENDEIRDSSAVCLGLAVDALERRLRFAAGGVGAGPGDAIFALGAAHLPLGAIVAIVALNQ